MSDVEHVLKIAAKHGMWSKVGMCCGAFPCDTAVLLEEIKRLNGLAVGLLEAVSLLQQPRGDDTLSHAAAARPAGDMA